MNSSVRIEGEPPERRTAGPGGVARREISLQVNGELRRGVCEPRMTLVDFLRETLGLTGTHVGCEHGVCGACTILMDGASVRSCLLFAVQSEGAQLITVEGLATPAGLSDLQCAFREHHALQCGFCTPGMLITAEAMLTESLQLDEDAVRKGISGNLCRCTGYQPIVDAILDCARTRCAAAAENALEGGEQGKGEA